MLNDELDIVREANVEAAGKLLVAAIDSMVVDGRDYCGMTRVSCALLTLFMRTLSTSSPTASETPNGMR